jgi:pimeloyl-ACP methyl ester carboxylesterase
MERCSLLSQYVKEIMVNLRVKEFGVLVLLGALLFGSGCGGFTARRIANAPNRYPKWLAPEAPVALGIDPKALSYFPSEYIEVGPPEARLRYRLIRSANYQFKSKSKSWLADGKTKYEFDFEATVPGRTNEWSVNPRGTVILLHGYGVGGFSMLPWGLSLAEAGWNTVLLDLRGHGRSTGKRIYYGIVETNDLSHLLDVLRLRGELRPPVAVVGDSYGASLALRWAGVEPRVKSVVAISPYGNLGKAILNIVTQYANWIPKGLIRAGIKKLPELLGATPEELNMGAVLERTPVKAFFIAGTADRTVPLDVVRRLEEISAPGSKLLIVPGAEHEALPFFHDELYEPIVDWLENSTNPGAEKEPDAAS